MTTIHPTAVAVAAVAAGMLSGIPSSVHALATGESPLDAVRAAGTIAVGEEAPPTTRLVAGFAVHGALSLCWTAVLAAIPPQRHPVVGGVLAGFGIAVVDLSIAHRRYPAIAALPRGAQVADHVAFGAIAGFVLGRARRRARDYPAGSSIGTGLIAL
jgi:hypothetical protein